MAKRFWTAAILVAVMLLISACKENGSAPQETGGYQTVRLVMEVSGTENGINALTAKKIAELVKEESQGDVIIEVYADDRLAGGNTTQGVKMIASGAVDFAAYTSGTLSMLDQHMSIGTMPWAFQSYQDACRIIDTTGEVYYEKLLARQGLVYLGSVHNGFRQISNDKHPVRTPEDLKTLKIRVPGNRTSMLFFQLLGAEAVPMSWSEVPTAIRHGSIDGHEVGIFTTASANLNEVHRYMTIWNYAYENYLFVANSDVFNGLELKTQRLIREKTREACAWGRDMVEQNERKMLEEFIHGGMEITELTPEELDAFREKSRPLIQQLKETYGQEACKAFQIQ